MKVNPSKYIEIQNYDQLIKEIGRFWKKVFITDGCWFWLGAKNHGRMPYGAAWFNSQHVLAHRFSYLIHNGKIPQDLLVLHNCDNPSCVNPKHLYLGTPKQNNSDCIKRGRANLQARSAENHWQKKLNWEKIKEIRSLYAKGWSQRKLARKFNIAYSSLFSITSGQSWKDPAYIPPKFDHRERRWNKSFPPGPNPSKNLYVMTPPTQLYFDNLGQGSFLHV